MSIERAEVKAPSGKSGPRHTVVEYREDGIYKSCSKCGEFKRHTEFSRNSGISHGMSPRCKECSRRKFSEDELAKMRADYASKRQHHLDYKLFQAYGITRKQWNQMTESQDYRCASCGDVAPLCVDHDHATGEVRGLLCTRCNTALGLLREDTEIIVALAVYIEKFEVGTCR